MVRSLLSVVLLSALLIVGCAPNVGGPLASAQARLKRAETIAELRRILHLHLESVNR